MIRSELIQELAKRFPQLSNKDCGRAVGAIIDFMVDGLSRGIRVEVRRFGSFCLHYRGPRQARNPKTGEVFYLDHKYVPYFKPGKELKERVNASKK